MRPEIVTFHYNSDDNNSLRLSPTLSHGLVLSGQAVHVLEEWLWRSLKEGAGIFLGGCFL